jgi:hypothetical protein
MQFDQVRHYKHRFLLRTCPALDWSSKVIPLVERLQLGDLESLRCSVELAVGCIGSAKMNALFLSRINIAPAFPILHISGKAGSGHMIAALDYSSVNVVRPPKISDEIVTFLFLHSPQLN